jgi:hypothetical protein
MRRLIYLAAFMLSFVSSAFGQGATCSYIAYGTVLTAGQWNACFSQKQDFLGYTPVKKAGDIMLGPLVTTIPSATASGFNLPHGAAPTSPVNGDIWTTTAGLFVQINGTTIGPVVGPGGGVLTAGSTVTSGYSSGQILGSNGSVLSVYSVTGTGNVVLGTSPTITTPVINGTSTGTGVASIATASTIVIRDANANAIANNFVFTTANVASAGGTTILTNASARYQRITGSTTQTFRLPDATTLANGWIFEFDNNSTGAVTINNNGSSLITTVQPGAFLRLAAVDTSTTNGTWDPHWLAPANVSFSTNGLSYIGTSANALTAGPNGTTNPAFNVDGSTASLAAGLNIKGAATGGTVAISAIDSGSNTNLSIDAKGSGTITLNGTATGGIILSRALTYGGVTLNNVVTGTGNMVLSTNPTLTTPVINVGSDATGDIYYRNSSGLFTRLPVGSNGQALELVSGLPAWATLSGTGTVTNVATGSGLTGGPITTTGTISLASQPAFSATLSASQTGVASNTTTLVTFNTVSYNVGSFFNTSTNRWVPPAGTIVLDACTYATGSLSTAGSFSTFIYKNGSGLYQAVNDVVTTQGGNCITVQDRANGTDYYQVYVNVTTTAGTATLGNNTAPALNFFQGHWVSP